MIDMQRRTKILFIAIPAFLAILIGLITTLSLPVNVLPPENIPSYTTVQYTSSIFTVNELDVKYYNPDELTLYLTISGGDGSQDLHVEFICRDVNEDHIYAGDSGSIYIEVIGDSLTNTISINQNDLILGYIDWVDVPSGIQEIKATIDLTDIVLDTESFFVELRDIN